MPNGLLGPVAPACPYGHGAMNPVRGWWALTGVDVHPMAEQVLGMPRAASITPNNQALALRAWLCPKCRNVQLFDGGDDAGV